MPLAAPVTAAADPRIVVIEFQLHVGTSLARPPLYGRRALATGRGSCLRALHAALKWCGVIYLLSRPTAMTWLRRAFAGGFAALGARLAFAER
jgi:hypothetical protein